MTSSPASIKSGSMSQHSIHLDLPDQAATEALAVRLANLARRRDVLALEGDLGTGKTVLARAFVHARGSTEEVPSPTFTLVQVYELAGTPVFHFDLYRLCNPDEAWELDLDDAFADGISLIEWPGRLEGGLPREHLLEVALRHAGGDARRATLTGHGDWPPRLKEAFPNDNGSG